MRFAPLILTLLLSGAAMAADEPTQLGLTGCKNYAAVAASGTMEIQGNAPKGGTESVIAAAELPPVIDKLLRQALHDGEISKSTPDEVFQDHLKMCIEVRGEIKKLLHPEI